MLVNDLALLLDLFGNSEETKLLICKAIFVWCLQRHRNGGLNSGLKSAIIVTDALIRHLKFTMFELYRHLLRILPYFAFSQDTEFCSSIVNTAENISRLNPLYMCMRHRIGVHYLVNDY